MYYQYNITYQKAIKFKWNSKNSFHILENKSLLIYSVLLFLKYVLQDLSKIKKKSDQNLIKF